MEFKKFLYYVVAVLLSLGLWHISTQIINQPSTELFMLGSAILVGLLVFWVWEMGKLKSLNWWTPPKKAKKNEDCDCK